MFCKTCGSILKPQHTSYGKWLSCPDGHTQEELQNKTQTINTKNNTPGQSIEVSDGINILAVHEHTCKRCGYNKAELIEMLASYSDEDNTYRMKCGKCGYVEQLEGKVK